MSVLVPDLDKIRGQLENEYLPLNLDSIRFIRMYITDESSIYEEI